MTPPSPPAPRQRRALSHQAGALRTDGDGAAAKLLSNAFQAARKADARGLTHGFHSYPARLHPRIARVLLAARAQPGHVVCDPFCGSGTTLVEALVAGCRGLGSDLNPLALELTRMKALAPTDAQRTLPDEIVLRVGPIAEASLQRVKQKQRTLTSGEAWDDPAMYAPHVFRELVGLRELLDDPPGGKLGTLLRRALLLSFSAILIKVSHQPSETGAGLAERTIGKGLPTRMFQRKAEELAASLRALFAHVPPGTPNPIVHKADARRLKHVDDAAVDLVITSPPYAGTYDYAAHHARRLGWLGLDAGALAHNELGPRRQGGTKAQVLARWQEQLDPVVAELARVLKPGGSAFVIIGDSRIGTERVAGDRAARVAAERAGLAVRASCAEERSGPREDRGQGAPRGAPPAPIEEHLLELRRA